METTSVPETSMSVGAPTFKRTRSVVGSVRGGTVDEVGVGDGVREAAVREGDGDAEVARGVIDDNGEETVAVGDGKAEVATGVEGSDSEGMSEGDNDGEMVLGEGDGEWEFDGGEGVVDGIGVLEASGDDKELGDDDGKSRVVGDGVSEDVVELIGVGDDCEAEDMAGIEDGDDKLSLEESTRVTMIPLIMALLLLARKRILSNSEPVTMTELIFKERALKQPTA